MNVSITGSAPGEGLEKEQAPNSEQLFAAPHYGRAAGDYFWRCHQLPLA
jgi:hypothetical protein